MGLKSRLKRTLILFFLRRSTTCHPIFFKKIKIKWMTQLLLWLITHNFCIFELKQPNFQQSFTSKYQRKTLQTLINRHVPFNSKKTIKNWKIKLIAQIFLKPNIFFSIIRGSKTITNKLLSSNGSSWHKTWSFWLPKLWQPNIFSF